MRGASDKTALQRRMFAVTATPLLRDLRVPPRRCDAVLARTSAPALASAPLTLTPRGDAVTLSQTVRLAGWGAADELLAVLATPGATEEQVAFVAADASEVRPIFRRFATPLLPRLMPDRQSVLIPAARGEPGAIQFVNVNRRGTRPGGAMTVSSPVLDAAVISRSSGAAVTLSLADYGIVYDPASGSPIEREPSGLARAVSARPGSDALSYVLADRIVHDGCEAPFPVGAFYRAAWSADGRYLAALISEGETLPAQSVLFVWDTQTGVVREAMRDAGVTISGLTWHPRVDTLLMSVAAIESAGHERLWQVNPETGSQQIALDKPLFAPAYWGVVFDPDGARLAVGCPAPDAASGIVTRGAICLYDVTLP
jgi:hypothetical protein